MHDPTARQLAEALAADIQEFDLANLLSDVIDNGTTSLIHVETRDERHHQLVVSVQRISEAPAGVLAALNLDSDVPPPLPELRAVPPVTEPGSALRALRQTFVSVPPPGLKPGAMYLDEMVGELIARHREGRLP